MTPASAASDPVAFEEFVRFFGGEPSLRAGRYRLAEINGFVVRLDLDRLVIEVVAIKPAPASAADGLEAARARGLQMRLVHTACRAAHAV